METLNRLDRGTRTIRDQAADVHADQGVTKGRDVKISYLKTHQTFGSILMVPTVHCRDTSGRQLNQQILRF